MPNLVGIGLSQVPTNSMLGGMAYQDPEHASIKNLDLKNLSQINSEIADTASAIFVYDTRKDSDGGAWRKKTRDTSWYNETLGTEFRGTRKEFPAVAVIVAQTSKLTIYDADDPNLPMWMVFEGRTVTSGHANFLGAVGQAIGSVAMLNGNLCIGFPSSNGWGMNKINFVSDSQLWYWGTLYLQTANRISERNTVSKYIQVYPTTTALGNSVVNDIALTVLPNSEIDVHTGLPNLTMAVSHHHGVSVITSDGTVSNTTSSNSGYRYSRDVEWSANNDLLFVMGDANGVLDYLHTYDGFNTRSNTITIDSKTGSTLNARSAFRQAWSSVAYSSHMFDGFTVQGLNTASTYAKLEAVAKNQPLHYAVRSASGLTHIIEDPDRRASLVSYTTDSYVTGYLQGDVRASLLASTVEGTDPDYSTGVTGTNLITNGTFNSDTSNWTSANGSTLTQQNNGNPGGNINVLSGASSNGYAYQTVTTVVGKAYILSLDHYHVDGSAGYVNIGTSVGGSQNLYKTLGTASSWTRYTFTFVATGTSTTVGVYSRPGGNVRYDNIDLRLADQDRSEEVQDKISNGVGFYGTITKSSVATGAELVAYGGFSGSNYMRNDTTYNFGNPCSVVMTAWFNVSDVSAYQYLTSIYDSTSNKVCGMALFVNTGKLYLFDTDAAWTADTASLGDGQWHQAVGIISGDQRITYIDGKRVYYEDAAGTQPDMSNTSRLSIGHYNYQNNLQYSWNGKLSLVRYSTTAPTADQVQKMYEEEKHLFQENAQATLYGSSPIVTAVAYDKDTEILHAGTSAGRSEFQGLRRINNTTTAVTTAISASNGLVAEQ